MRNLILTLAFLFGALQLQSQAVNWGHSFGTTKNLSSNFVQYPHEVRYFNHNTLYAAGRLQDTMIVGKDTISNFNNEFWLSKIDVSGKIHWVKSIAERLSSYSTLLEVHSMEVDSSNNCIYLGGSIGPGTYRFGPDTLDIPWGDSELFLIKLDTSGTPIWASASKRFGTIPLVGHTSINDIELSPDSSIVVVGSYSGNRLWYNDTLDAISSTNRRNGFVSKIDQNGNLIWNLKIKTTQAGFGNYSCFAKTLSTNPNGSSLIAGVYTGDSLIIGSQKLFNTGFSKNFLAFIDPNGVPVYAKHMGSPTNISDPRTHELQRYGDYVYAGFSFFGSLNIPELGQTFTSQGSGSGYSYIIIKLSKTGFAQKAFLLPNNSPINTAKFYVKADHSKIYALSNIQTGFTSGGFTYGTGLNLTTIDSSDMVLCNVPIGNGDIYRRPSIDGNGGDLAFCGHFTSPINQGIVNINNHGTQMSFVMSVAEGYCGTVSTSLNNHVMCEGDSVLRIAPTGYNSYLWSNGVKNDSVYIHEAGDYSCTLENAQAAFYTTNKFSISYHQSSLPLNIMGDSVICTPGDSLVLTANPLWSNIIWNNGVDTGSSLTIDTSGSYYFRAIDTLNSGCMFYSDTFKVRFTSMDTLALIGIPANACPGDSISLQWMYSSKVDSSSLKLSSKQSNLIQGSYFKFDTAGTFLLELSAKNLDSCSLYQPYWINVSGPVVQISRANDSLMSNYVTGNQWYFNGGILVNDTLPNLPISSNGIYTLYVRDTNGCVDSSSIDIQDFSNSYWKLGSNRFQFYPNPVQDILHFEIVSGSPNANLQVLDLRGAVLFQKELNNHLTDIDISHLPSGTYILKIEEYAFKLSKH